METSESNRLRLEVLPGKSFLEVDKTSGVKAPLTFGVHDDSPSTSVKVFWRDPDEEDEEDEALAGPEDEEEVALAPGWPSTRE